MPDDLEVIEVRAAKAELDHFRIIQQLTAALSTGAGRGPVGRMDPSTVTTNALRRGVNEAKASELGAQSSPRVKACLRTAELILGLRRALAQLGTEGQEAPQAVLEALTALDREGAGVLEVARVEVTRAHEEVDTRYAAATEAAAQAKKDAEVEAARLRNEKRQASSAACDSGKESDSGGGSEGEGSRYNDSNEEDDTSEDSDGGSSRGRNTNTKKLPKPVSKTPPAKKQKVTGGDKDSPVYTNKDIARGTLSPADVGMHAMLTAEAKQARPLLYLLRFPNSSPYILLLRPLSFPHVLSVRVE